MKKKIITTATTAILALGLLQAASTAYAADEFSVRVGGVGHGTTRAIDNLGNVGNDIGSMVIKLNGILENIQGSYIGEGYINQTTLGMFEPIRSQFTFDCPATAVGNTEHEVAIGLVTVDECSYVIVDYPDGFILTSDGECYITRDAHGREMACNFMYTVSEQQNGEVPVSVTPMSFSHMFS